VQRVHHWFSHSSFDYHSFPAVQLVHIHDLSSPPSHLLVLCIASSQYRSRPRPCPCSCPLFPSLSPLLPLPLPIPLPLHFQFPHPLSTSHSLSFFLTLYLSSSHSPPRLPLHLALFLSRSLSPPTVLSVTHLLTHIHTTARRELRRGSIEWRRDTAASGHLQWQGVEEKAGLMAVPSVLFASIGRNGTFDKGWTLLEAQAHCTSEHAIDISGNLVRGSLQNDGAAKVDEHLSHLPATRRADDVPWAETAGLTRSISRAGNFKSWTPLCSLLVPAELRSIARTGQLVWTSPASRTAVAAQGMTPQAAVRGVTAAGAEAEASGARGGVWSDVGRISASSIRQDGSLIHSTFLRHATAGLRSIDEHGNLHAWSLAAGASIIQCIHSDKNRHSQCSSSSTCTSGSGWSKSETAKHDTSETVHHHYCATADHHSCACDMTICLDDDGPKFLDDGPKSFDDDHSSSPDLSFHLPSFLASLDIGETQPDWHTHNEAQPNWA